MSFLTESAFFYLAMIYLFAEIFNYSHVSKIKEIDTFKQKETYKNIIIYTILASVLFVFLNIYFNNTIYSIITATVISLSVVSFPKNKIEKHKNHSDKIGSLIFLTIIFSALFFIPLMLDFNIERLIELTTKLVIGISIGFLGALIMLSTGRRHLAIKITISILVYIFAQTIIKYPIISVLTFAITYSNLESRFNYKAQIPFFSEMKGKMSMSKEEKKQETYSEVFLNVMRIVIMAGMLLFSLPQTSFFIFSICGVFIAIWFLFGKKSISVSFLPLVIILHMMKLFLGYEPYFMLAYSIIFYLTVFVLIINYKDLFMIAKNIFK